MYMLASSVAICFFIGWYVGIVYQEIEHVSKEQAVGWEIVSLLTNYGIVC